METTANSRLTLHPVFVDDLEKIMAFYQSYIGTPGCTWNEYYPNKDILRQDYESANLYGLYKDDELIGSISVSSDNHMDDLPCWQYTDNTKEIARVVISPKHRGQHYGQRLLQLLFDHLRKQGVKTIHLLVSPDNTTAINLYLKFKFENRGKYYLYEHDYLAFEAKI